MDAKSWLSPLQLVDSIEGAALAGAVDALLVTQQNADRAGIAGPAQGWGSWAAALSAAAQGQLEAAPADGSIGTQCIIMLQLEAGAVWLA